MDQKLALLGSLAVRCGSASKLSEPTPFELIDEPMLPIDGAGPAPPELPLELVPKSDTAQRQEVTESVSDEERAMACQGCF